MKLDSKIRFQHGSFRRQLRDARGYKRSTRKIPEGRWQVFLNRAGLGSWWSKTAAAAVFFGLLYLAFVPNFLFIKTIDVSGAKQSTRESVAANVNNFLNAKTHYLQRNIIFLSKKSLSKNLLGGSDQIVSINSITKSFPNKITINITPRQAAFSVQSSSQDIVVSNDGQILETFDHGAMPTSTGIGILKPVSIATSTNAHIGDKIFDSGLLGNINELWGDLGTNGQITTDHILLNDINDTDISAITRQGFEIKFTRGENMAMVLEQLKLLLSNLTQSQFNNLYYIDMRFAERGYLCLKNTPCTQKLKLKPTDATGTPDSILPGTATSTAG